MVSALTRLVRSLGHDEPELTTEEFDSAARDLRRLLVIEMKRRGLWTSPPTYVGIVGRRTWVDAEAETDALDELTFQCLEEAILRRRASLLRHARSKSDIDGLVRLNVRHFLLDAQRRNDPLGFRIYEVLYRVVEHGEDLGRLALLRKRKKITNRTWIAARHELLPDGTAAAQSLFDPGTLATRWTADPLDGLITSQRADLSHLVDELAHELADALLSAGTDGLVRFGKLAGAVKTAGRQAWAQRSDEARHRDRPDRRLERRQQFERLDRCVERSIETLEERKKTLRYLRRLWRFLRALALGGGGDPDFEDLQIFDSLEPGTLPPHRQLGRLLDIPRERLPDLLETLGRLFRSCLRSVGTAAAATSKSTTGGPAMSEPSEAASRDRARAALARARSQIPSSLTSPEVGQILDLPGVEIDGVFWLVAEIDPIGDRCLLAAVDQSPLLGPDDTVLRSPEDGAPWTQRHGFERWVSRKHFETMTEALRVDRLAPEELDEARGGEAAEGSFRLDPELPAYRDWLERGPEAAMARLASLPTPFPAARSRSRAVRRVSAWQAVAAILVLTAGGLLYRLHSAERQIAQLAQPIVDLPYREIQLGTESRGEVALDPPPSAGHVQIGLILPRLPDAERVRILLVRDGDPEPLFRSERLVPALEYSLTIPEELVADLPVTIQISDADGGDDPPLFEQTVRWEPEVQ